MLRALHPATHCKVGLNTELILLSTHQSNKCSLDLADLSLEPPVFFLLTTFVVVALTVSLDKYYSFNKHLLHLLGARLFVQREGTGHTKISIRIKSNAPCPALANVHYVPSAKSGPK